MDEIINDKRFAHIAKDPKFRRIPKAERKVKIDKRFQSMFKDKKFSVKYTIDKRGRPVNHSTTEDLRKYYELSSSDEGKAEEKEDAEDEKHISKIKKKKGDINNKISKKTSSKLKNVGKESSESWTVSNIDENEKQSVIETKVLKKKPEKNKKKNSDTASLSKIHEDNLDENEKQLIIKNKTEKEQITKNIKQKLRDLTIDYARGEGVLLSDSSSEESSSSEEEGKSSNLLRIF